MNPELYPESPVLIVDDDKNFLNSVETTLLTNGITNVECCEDSREVMALLKNKKFSLVFLDLSMPNLSGEELLPQIIEEYPEIKVIILTGIIDVETAVACMKQGAADFVMKPIDTPRLIETIRNNLSAVGKEQSIIKKLVSKTKNKQINRDNIRLFSALAQAYEKVERFGKAALIYRDIAKFDPNFPGIRQKLEKIEKLKEDIIQIYHKEKYDKIKKIGAGGIGVVYRAKDTKLERMVALKILNKSSIEDDREKTRATKRFFSEAKNIARLQHPNIVAVYESGQIENDYFISMEFIEGEDLDTIIGSKHPLSIPSILIIAKKIFTALAHSHKNGVIHRDIKPGNIMITYDNEVKVVDFGIALLKDESKPEDGNSTYGTPFYMSPEQFENTIIDHLSDIYSAGVTLFHLAAGEAPFDATTYIKIMSKHIGGPIPSISDYRGDVPNKFKEIIEKCMAKDKADRYRDAGQVIEEIDGIRDNSGKTILTNKTKLEIFDADSLNGLQSAGRDNLTPMISMKSESSPEDKR